MACLTRNQKKIEDKCFFESLQVQMNVFENAKDDKKKCHDELRSKCGKQIDELKKAIQETSIIGTLKGAVDVVECVVSHAEDLWEKCKPFEEENSPSSTESDCQEKAAKACSSSRNKVTGLGYTLGCLAEQSFLLGDTCMIEQMLQAIDEAENSSDQPCHDELRKKCGKQIDELKKELEHTSVIGIIKGAVDVASCIAENAEDLWKKCNPFEDENNLIDETANMQGEDSLNIVGGAPTPPTKKPTPKPTKRPTKKPTKAPTKKPTSKPTGRPSPKPTTKMVAEFLTNVSPSSEDEQGEEHEDMMMENHNSAVNMMEEVEEDSDEIGHRHRPGCRHGHHHRVPETEPMPVEFSQQTEVTTVEYDMDACIQSARRFCTAEIAAFNETPFDPSLLQALNDCIEANSRAIEADCVVSASRVTSYFPDFITKPHVFHMDEEEEQGPCKFPGQPGDLPICKPPKHRCHRHHHAFIAIVGAFVLFVVAWTVNYLTGGKVFKCGRKAQTQVQERNPQGYTALKSDNAPAVPANSIV